MNGPLRRVALIANMLMLTLLAVASQERTA